MAFEVEIHAAAESFTTEQGRQHAHDFGALVVDGGRVEIVDFPILVGSHGMGQRAGILGKLRTPERTHVLDPAQGTRSDVGFEFLLAIDGQAFLEAELEPVAAGDPVSGPVVEVFVTDHGEDMAEIVVRGMQRIGQEVLRVEDVETSVFHRTHGEIVGGDNVECVQPIASAITLLVPAEGRLEAIHRVPASIEDARIGPDREPDAAALGGEVGVLERVEAPGDQGEQIARLGLRIHIARPVPAVIELALAVDVTAGQQYRIALAIGAQGDRVARQHVGAIDRPGDMAEPFGFALGQQEPAFRRAAQVEALHRCVGDRPDP